MASSHSSGGAADPSAKGPHHRHGRHGRLHKWEAMPPHLQFNKFVLHGYRPHGPEHGVGAALASLLYFHNETLNVFTHLIGALICAYWAAFPPVDLPHYWAVRLADATAAVCLLGSATYHLFMSATPTRAEYTALLAADLFGVVLAGAGAAFAGGWLSLPCAPLPLVLGLCLLPSLIALGWVLFVARTAAERTVGAGLQIASRIVYIVGGAVTGAGWWPAPVLAGHLLSEGALGFGGLLSATRVPERWAPPGSPLFTFVLQSHIIMHVCAAGVMLMQHVLLTIRVEALAGDAAALACADARAASFFGAWPW